MGTVSLERAHVLNKDQLSPASQYSRDHNGYHTNPVYIDSGSIGNRTVLANGTELLTDLCFHQCIVKYTEQSYNEESDHWYTDHGK